MSGIRYGLELLDRDNNPIYFTNTGMHFGTRPNIGEHIIYQSPEFPHGPTRFKIDRIEHYPWVYPNDEAAVVRDRVHTMWIFASEFVE